jgi:hypothetical protein
MRDQAAVRAAAAASDTEAGQGEDLACYRY